MRHDFARAGAGEKGSVGCWGSRDQTLSRAGQAHASSTPAPPSWPVRYRLIILTELEASAALEIYETSCYRAESIAYMRQVPERGGKRT